MNGSIERDTGLACPACEAGMTRLVLDGHYGTTVDLDVCYGCHAIWFDDRENLRLTPGATLELFERIHDGCTATRKPLPDRMRCPRCQLRLLAAQDRQRNTPFRYRRCSRGHGRLITFFDFLREKEFVRPLDAGQIAALREQVRSVNCSNCGAPIDLVRASACGYCRTPLSMLDFGQIERMLGQLRQAEAGRRTATDSAVTEATLALALLRERRHVDAFFSEIERQPDWTTLTASGGLVEAGIGAVVGLLKRLR